jgi:hypothetical protein
MPHKSALYTACLSKQGWEDWMVGAPGLEPGPAIKSQLMIHFPALRAIAATGIHLLSLTWGLLALRIIVAPKWLRRCQRQIIARNPHLDRRPEGGAGRASAIKSWTTGAAPRHPRDPQGDQDLWQGLHRHALMTIIAYAFCNILASHRRREKNESTDLRLSQACRRYATPSSISFFERQLTDAHTADDEPQYV